MRNLQVGLDDRSYPIMIESGCLDRVAADLAGNIRQAATVLSRMIPLQSCTVKIFWLVYKIMDSSATY